MQWMNNFLPAHVNPEPDFYVDFGNHSNCLLSLKNHVSDLRCPSTASKNRPKNLSQASTFVYLNFKTWAWKEKKYVWKKL